MKIYQFIKNIFKRKELPIVVKNKEDYIVGNVQFCPGDADAFVLISPMEVLTTEEKKLFLEKNQKNGS